MATTNNEAGTGRQPTSSGPSRGSDDPTVAQTTAAPVSSPDALITTAEIPVTSSRLVSSRGPTSHYEDDWYHDRTRRLPAPVGLRIAVWLLFVVFVIFLIGLAIEHYHPTWISFLRQANSSAGVMTSIAGTNPFI